MIPSWLRNLAKLFLGNGKLTRRHRQKTARRPSFRPLFEHFEERLVPTTLSIPTTLIGARSGIVSVPINVDTLNDNSQGEMQSGLSGGEIVVWYNPDVFAVNPNTDVSLGTLINPSASDPSGTGTQIINGVKYANGYTPQVTNGWVIAGASTPNVGEISFGLYEQGGIPIAGTAGGTLAVINFHVLSSAPLGASMVDLAQDVQPGVGVSTFISDSIDNAQVSFQYVLNPTPLDNTGALQTITFPSGYTGGPFTLAFNGSTSTSITYSSVPSILQSNIQNALNTLDSIGPTGATPPTSGTDGNSLVVATSATTVTVTFQGALGGGTPVGGTLTASDPSITVSAPTDPTSGNSLVFGYYGLPSNDPTYTDPTDGTITITGVNGAPTANNDTYSITERDQTTDPSLSVPASIGVLANDTDPQGNTLTPMLLTQPSHGSLTLNNDGSFVYTSVTGYLGGDSFTYEDVDSAASLTSNVATVNLTVTSRLSIPTNITGQQGATITVPVSIDNPNPTSSGGLTGVQLAVEFDPNVLQVDTAVGSNGVLNGTITSGTDEVQTVTLGGSPTGGSFDLANGTTTQQINYSSNATTLESNIQSAVTALFGTTTPNTVTGPQPNALVSIASPTSFNVTFQLGLANLYVTPMTVTNNLSGSNATVAAAITTTGYSTWSLSATANNAENPGELGIAESTPNGQFSTIGGTIALIVFTINTNAPGGPSNIYLVPVVAPSGISVPTQTDYDGATHLDPRPPAQPYGTFVVGMDGTVTVSGASHFVISAPSNVAAGTGFTFTVVAQDAANNTATSYNGTVSFSSSDHGASTVLPVNGVLVAGVGTFSATLTTAGNQTLSATDTVNASIIGNSNQIQVSALAATHLAITAPTSAAQGTAFQFTVTAEDQFNNTAPSYADNVAFTSSDGAAHLPAASALTNGVGTFSGTLQAMGSQTLTAADATNGSITNGVADINVTSTTVTHFQVSAPANVTAGGVFAFTVTAESAANSVATGYTGTVTFTSSDGKAHFVTTSSALNNGVGTFSATLETAGNQTLTATDTVANTLVGASGPIAVSATTATHFAISSPSTPTAGVGFSFTVTAEDPFNNTAPSYSGTVTFTSSDSTASFVPLTGALVNGVGAFSATLHAAGSQTLVATDVNNSGVTGAGAVDVQAAAATHFVVIVPTTATAGSAAGFTVIAEDQFNNTATSYTGTVGFTSTDAAAGFLPSTNTLSAGVGSFTATFHAAGPQTITATDTVATTLTGTGGPVTVSAATANHFVIGAPSAATAGAGFTFTVTAEDVFNNTATSYAGTVTFASTDKSASTTLPLSGTLQDGMGTFTATLTTAGNQVLTAGDSQNATVTGSSNTITVSAAQTQKFAVTAPGAATAGVSFQFTVMAEDKFGNLTPTYSGSVQFTSTDSTVGSGNGTLPASTTLAGGVGTFSATLQTEGSQSLKASDTNLTSINGNSNNIQVSGATADHLQISAPTNVTAGAAFSFTVTAEDKFNNTASGYTGTVGFASTDSGASTVLPNSSALTNSVGTFSATLTTSGTQTLSSADTVATTLSGISGPIHVSAAQATHFVIQSQSAATAGVGFNIVVTAEDQFNNTATAYSGSVVLSSSDTNSGVKFQPNGGPLTNGQGTFLTTLITAGVQTVSAADSVNTSVTGASGPITVNAATTTHFVLIVPVAASPGNGFAFTVVAEDAFNNTAPTYSGTVVFTSSDTANTVVLPGPGQLTNGVGTFSATLQTQGSRTLTASDAAVHSITGHSGPINVTATGATHFAVTAPSNASAGQVVSFTVVAETSSGNSVATGYTGTVSFSSTDTQAGFAPNSTRLTNGQGSFSVTLLTAGNQMLFASDNNTSGTTGSITGTSNSITVTAGVTTQLGVIAPANATAGVGFSFTVTTEDQFNNPTTGFTGTVALSTSDSGGIVPLTGALTNGIGSFSATLVTAGSQSLTAINLANSLTGTSGPIDVHAGAASHFVVNAPASSSAGSGFNVTVTAEDAFNNTATSYAGTVVLSSSDSTATLQGGKVLTSGLGTFSATLVASGNQTLTAADSVTSSINGTAIVNVGGSVVQPATHFVVSAPSNVTAGTVFDFTVTAETAANSAATSYTGTVTFSSSDHGASTVLPVDATLVNGIGTFSATLATAGSQTLTAADTVSATITAGTAALTVSAASASHFVVSAPATSPVGSGFNVTVTAEDKFNNTATTYAGTVVLTSSDSAGTLEGGKVLSNGVGTFSATLVTSGNQTLTAADSVTSSINGTAVVDVGAVVQPATHFVLSAPSNVTAGTVFSFTVTAETAANSAATSYTGTVTFSSSDHGASTVLPVDATLVNGIGTFNATLSTAGNQTLTAADTVSATITAGTAALTVSAASASHFVVSAPATSSAGSGFNLTVTAEDKFNNTATTYAGTVVLTSSDGAATLEGGKVLNNGVGTFSATLATAGNQTLTAADSVTSSINGTAVVDVGAVVQPATHFVLSAPSNVTAGTVFSFTVTAETAANSAATSYTGTVTFSSSDHGASTVLPLDAALVNGIGTFDATLSTASNQTLTAADTVAASITAGTATLTVSAASASHFVVTAPASSSSGSGFDLTVTAEDKFNNTATNYAGTVVLTSSDSVATLEGGKVLTNGVGTFSATLVTSGNQTLTAADSVTSSINGTAVVDVGAVVQPATHFVLSAPSNVTAGTVFSITVTAETAGNSAATSYTGTVTFSSSDHGTSTVLPADATLVNGIGTFNATLSTVGSQTLTAADTVTASITAGTATLTVSAVPATHFVVSAPSNVTAGTVFSFTVTAETAANSAATGYTGTVTFSSSDHGVSTELPVDATLVSGIGTFSATLTTAGSQTLTAADTVAASITAGTAALTVNAASATHFVVTGPTTATTGSSSPVTVTAEDQFNNTATGYAGTVAFSSSDSVANLPANGTLNNGVGVFGVTFQTPGSQSVTATDTVNSTIKGAVTLNVSAASASHFVLSAPSTVAAGTSFSVTVTAETGANAVATGYTGTVAFSSSDHGISTVLPINGTLVNGIGTFNATLTTAGGQELTATDTVNSGITGTAPITVSAAAASHYLLNAPVAVSPTVAFNFTVTAEDKFNNIATSYTGLAAFTSSDSAATLPGARSLNNGVGIFTATLATLGNQNLTATDTVNSGITASVAINVSNAAASHFVVSAPTSATAGTGFKFTVTAETATDTTASAYAGTVHFSSSDLGLSTTLPADATLVNGVGVFSATLTTAGAQSLTATDTTNSGLNGSAPVNVTATVVTHFSVTAPSSTTAGNAFVFTVTAEDKFNNTASSYSGTVHFTSSDAQAQLPPNATLVNGSGNFAAILKTAGIQTLTATDVTNATLTAPSNPITVSAATATHFAVTAPTTTAAGSPFHYTVTAQDQFNNTATTFGDFVTFTSSDSAVSFTTPINGLTNGVGTFNAILRTAGNQTITATDATTTSIVGVSNTINVTAAQAAKFVVSAPASASAGTAFIFTVTAEDSFNNTATSYSGSVHFTSTDSQAQLPADATLTAGTGVFPGILRTVGLQTLSAADTVATSITAGSAAVNVNAGAATHFVVSAPTTTASGSPIKFTVSAEDQFNNVVTGFNDFVTFTSSDSAANFTLTGSTLSNGEGTFNAILKTAGNQTLTAGDAQNVTVTGASNTINVTAGTATHFVVSAPTAATSGVAFTFTVIAEDASNNTATGYTGTVTFSTSDSNHQLPSNATLTNGTGVFAALLRTPGNQTITAGDTTNGTLTSASNTITVTSAAATHFAITAPAGTVPGAGFAFTVTAEDSGNNLASGYTGTVVFSSSDGTAHLPVNSTLVNGIGTFSATLSTVGNQTLTAIDSVTSSVQGASNTIVVSATSATHFVVSAPSTVTAGGQFSFTVTAETSANTTATGYTGTVSFSTTDSAGSFVPVTATLVNGVGTFSATLKTTGVQFIAAADTANNTLTNTSNAINVVASPVTHFIVTAPVGASQGVPFNFTVKAEDQFNNLATNYVGLVHFATSDGAGTVPADSSLVSGLGTFSATLLTAGTQTITAADSVTTSVTGVSGPITVSAAATHFVVTAPSNATAGTSFLFTVTAEAGNNTTATGYTGTVHFTSSDSNGTVPVNATLTNGLGTFSATLVTAGNQTLTATDAAASSLSGASNAINVTALSATHFAVTAPATTPAGSLINFTVTAEDKFNNTATTYNGTADFTSSDTAGTVTPNGTLSNGVGVFSATLVTAGNQTITATDSVTSSIAGTSNTIAVTAATTTHFVITIPSRWTAGQSFKVTVLAEDQFNNVAPNYTGTVHFTSSDGASNVSLPANTTLSSGQGTFSATLRTAGSQTLTATDTVSSSVTGTSPTVINAVPTLGALSSTSTAPEASYTATIPVNNGTSPFTLTTPITGLPPGVSPSLSGSTITLAGTPTTTGTYTFSVTVTDAAGAIATNTYTISVSTGPSNLRWVFF